MQSYSKLKIFKKILLIAFINSFLYANSSTIIQSQPQVIFELDKLKNSSENLEIQVDFNKAVLNFKKGDYETALKLFSKTSKVFEVPSLLNIGIIHHKQNNKEKALEMFRKIYQKKTNLLYHPYSFISSCYYLFEITKDDKYMLDLVKIFQNSKKLSEHNELITDIKDVILKDLSNRYLYIKDYENALAALNAMSYSLDLKKAMIYIKMNNFSKASSILKKLKIEEKDEELLNKVLWISTYTDLKLNKFEDVQETLELIESRRKTFKVNTQMPFKIFFNKNLYTYKDYFKTVLKFDENRKLDFLYYFAPYVFSDSKEIIYDSVKGFIFANEENVENLESMVEFNNKFVSLMKQDPINRVNELKLVTKDNSKAYMFYNLALSYAQVNDFFNAFKNFEKAYKLNPGNKLYAVMYLITSDKISESLNDKQREFIDKNIREASGSYSYFGKELYKIFINNSYNVSETSNLYKNTIFYKAMDFLKKMYNSEPLNKHPLLLEYERDPFVYLLKLIQREDKENDYEYFSRMQDNIPLKYNNNFIENSWIISRFYIDILKALGLLKVADFEIQGNDKPSYLLTTAYTNLYLGRPNVTVNNLKILKERFSYENRFSMYLTVASLLESNRPEDASIEISLIKAFYNDNDTDFLTAIQLIQNMNINSAKHFLYHKYNNPYIDFKIVGFDDFMLLL